MSRKVKYLLASIISAILVICAMWTFSKASSSDVNAALDNILAGNWVVGEGFPISFSVLQNRDDLFCIQHSGTMRDQYDYVLRKYFRIEGNIASDETGDKTVNSHLNGMFAYIANLHEGYGYYASDGSGYTGSQRAIYAMINRWFSEVGSQFGYDRSNYGNTAYESYPNQTYYDAKAYAESIGNIANPEPATDNTNRDNLQVTSFMENGEAYTKVGPFNWTFSGHINSIALTGDNGGMVASPDNNNSLRISVYIGNEERYIIPNALLSGQNFYLTFKTSEGFSSIEKIQGTGAYDAGTYYTTDVFFFESSGKQNLILVNPGENTVTQQIEVTIENIPLTKDLTIVKVDEDDHNITLANVGFKFLHNETQKYLRIDENGLATYVDTLEEATEFSTDSNGKIFLDNILAGTYTAIETKNPNYGYADIEDGIIIPVEATEYTIENDNITKDLVVYKVDADNNQIRLEGVGFIFYNNDTGEYIKEQIINGDSITYTYTPNRAEAHEFVTDSEGKINLPNIIEGTYTAYETKLGDNYGYVLREDGYQIAFDSTQVDIPNKQLYVKLSGYVWEDIQSEKQSIRNDLYKDSENDDKDSKVQGVTVRLRDKRTGQIVKDAVTGRDQVATTNENGEYIFENVLIDDLSNYYVEFTYDGLTYESVIPHIDKDNGSKASEPDRQGFNNKFASVEAGSKENEAAIKDASGNVQATVEYNFTQETNGRTANIVNKTNCDIISTTTAAGYTISYTRGSGVKEIKNINLGIYKRRQADLALQNELDQVKVEIEGYGHIYKYGSGFNTNDPNETQNSWNLGVRFENPYKNVYKRPIYRADAEYDNDDESKELKVALTYKITLANQENVTSRVNSIVDYFDARYTIKGVGTGVSEQDGKITNPIKYTESNYNDKYKKVDIDVDMLLQESAEGSTADKVTQKSIYIQFDLSRENILNMLNDASIYGNDENRLEEAGRNLKNTAEITSFTTYSDTEGRTLYAAVDKDSIPGNATVDNYSTYEDDTDKASTLAIVIANAREVSGIVFEDKEDETLSTEKNISQGDATFDEENENTIGGVKVQLVKVDSNGNVTDEVAKVFDEQVVNPDGTLGAWTDANAEAVSDSDGNYAISGFIPGKYAIKYIWGDGSYKIVDGQKGDEYDSMVENYKATVIDYDTYQSEAKNNKFYRDANESDVRTSHAMDNITTRKEVDETLKNYNYESQTDVTEMTSTTPVMEFNIEYDDNDLMSIDLNRVENRIAFKIKNIDFGIIRRPIQDVNFVKTLSDIRLTLANGQVLIDAKVTADGKLDGQAEHTTYMPPRKENGITVDNGYLKIEMDEDLIQGATVQMKFKLTTENTSQADYVDDAYGYYQYGESYYEKAVGEDRKDTDVITLTPSKIVDYLDPKSIYQPEDPTNIEYAWKQVSIEDLKNEKLVASNITDALETGEYDTGEVDSNGNPITAELDESQIFTTDYLDDAKLRPIYTKGDTLNPAEGGDVYMVVDKVLSTSEDLNFQNQAELVLLGKPGGGKFTPTPGNYLPNRVQKETDDSTSQEISIVPSTGGNRNFILPISVGMVALVVLATGVVLIKKKVLNPQNRKND